MKVLSFSLLALATTIAALSSQLVAGHPVSIKRKNPVGWVDTGYYLDVNLTSSVADLKKSLAEKYQVPTDLFSVFWRGSSRPDQFQLSRAQDAPDQLLIVVDFRFVKVIKPGGGYSLFAVQQKDTIARIKDKITKTYGYPRDSQRLLCEEGGEELYDGQPLYTYKESDRLALILFVRQSRAHVRLPSGELVTFEFEPNEPVASLKVRLEQEKGIAREQQGLYFEDKELADDALLVGPTLTLVVRPTEQSNKVHVRLASRRLITFEVNLALDTGASLKGKISQAEGLEVAKLHLFATPDKELLDEEKLGDYRFLDSEPIVDLRVCPSGIEGVLVESVGGSPVGEFTQQLAINSTVTVADIKAELKQKKTILHDCRLHLFADGKELADTEKVSEHIRATSSPYLHLVTRRRAGPSVVHVKLPSGRLMTFEIAPTSPVRQLSAQIQREKQEFQANRQTLWFQDKQLANDESLSSYGVVSGSTVVLKLTPD